MPLLLTDTHQHLFCTDRWPYTWTRDVPQLAGKDFGYDRYLAAIAGTGINRTIFMETTPDDPHWQEETRWACDLADRDDTLIAGVIAKGRPEDRDGFAAYLDAIAHPRLVGLRRFLHAAPDETSEPAHFVDNLRRLAARNLTFDLCVQARQLPIASRLARACPEVQFVLDHCGAPDIAGDGLDPWREQVRILASRDNVACKLSGVFAYCRPGAATLDAVRPYLEHCLDVFGWDRVVWGGDWPVCTITSTLADWVAATREWVRGEDETHQRKLFSGNAERIYGLS